MVRILHVIGGMGCGGAETIIMNLYRNIDRNQIQFDFVVHTEEIGMYESEILEMGGRIFRVKKFNIVNYLYYRKWWLEFFEKHKEYRIIHGHINSSAAIYLSIAKRFGLKAIVHSHATSNTEISIRNLVFKIMSFPIRNIADVFFACSRQAGIDRYGKNVVNSDRFFIISNGINLKKYIYNNEKRKTIREEYGIDYECKVIGHVGRFTYAKNHEFIIDVFNEIQKLEKNTKLLFFGEGELENNIRNKVNQLKLDDKVIFMGVKSNIYDYYNVFDCFLFPSNFEGLGMALIEAQASGLHCVVSDVIQKEADIKAGLVNYYSCGEDISVWRDACIDACKSEERINSEKYVTDAGYDIYDIARKLQEYYLNSDKY